MGNIRELSGEKLVLVTKLSLSYMEPLLCVSRGKTGKADSGKPDYRHRSQTGHVEKRSGAHGCLCDPSMQDLFLYQNAWEVFLTRLPARHA